MKRLLDQINTLFNKDLTVYAASFLSKCIHSRMADTGAGSVDHYAEIISRVPGEHLRLFDSLYVPYSMFFRNLGDFCLLERYVLPELFSRKSKEHSSTVRIWSAGCAAGQEPYSLKIVTEEIQRKAVEYPPIMVFATDISEKYLTQARIGEYDRSSLQHVRLSHLDYFSKHSDSFSIAPGLKKNVEFSVYDLLDEKTSSPPSGIFGGFDIVCCCNLMIYYREDIQQMIISKLLHSLSAGGILMVDDAERAIVMRSKYVRPFSDHSNLFIKQ